MERLLTIPLLAIMVLLGWSLGLPLIYGIQAREWTVFADVVMYQNVCIMMFGQEAGLWILMSLGCFGVGCWLVLKSGNAKPVTGLALALVPVIVLGMAFFFSEYHGP